MISHALLKSLSEYEETEYKNSLPLYWLESDTAQQKLQLISPENVKEIKLVNKQIELLVGIITKVLGEISSEKYSRIMDIAKTRSELVKLLKQPKIKTLFELCERSSILTDIKCYSLINKPKNDSLNIIHNDKRIKSILLRFNNKLTERYINDIRFILLKEIQIQCQKSDLSQTLFNVEDENNKLQNPDMNQSNSFIRRIDFTEKPESSRSYDSKSDLSVGRLTMYKLDEPQDSFLKVFKNTNKVSNREKREIVTTLLRHMNNSQRIRVGNRVAELKSVQVTRGLNDTKVSTIDVMNEVLSKRSMEDLFKTCYSDESNSGATRISLIDFQIKKNLNSKNSQTLDDKLTDSYSLTSSDELIENQPSIMYASIRQDIIHKETDKKVKKFLLKE